MNQNSFYCYIHSINRIFILCDSKGLSLAKLQSASRLLLTFTRHLLNTKLASQIVFQPLS